MKGLTSVIALVMLLLITVGMVGIAYAWFSGLMTGQTEKTFVIQTGGAYCIKASSLNTIFVLVRNTGATSNLVGGSTGDFVTVRLDASPITPQSFDIPSGGSATLINTNCGTGCASGSHSIIAATRNSQAETKVNCP